MPENPQSDEIEIDVTFVRAGSGYLKGRPFPLAGPATVRIGADDTLTVTFKADAAPTSTQSESMTFALSQFANVGLQGRQVLFCIYPPDDAQMETPRYIGCMRVADRSAAERLFVSLPRRLSPAVERMSAERSDFITALLKVTPNAFVTPFILCVNVLVFTAMVVTGVGIINPDIEALIGWGADFGPLTFIGEWWRVVTNTFIHIGIIHLALNMWVLNLVGRLVERMFGNGPFLFIYLAAGVIGSLASLWMNPETVSAGASGAIFGLYGALIGFFLRQRHAIPKTVLKELQNSSLGFVAYNVIFGFSVAGIDNAAHLGGLFAGTVLGYIAALPLKSDVRRSAGVMRLAQTVAAFAVLALTLFMLTPRQGYRDYYDYIEYYLATEESAIDAQLEIAGQLDGRVIPPAAAADRLEEECLRPWRALQTKAMAIRLPPDGLYHENLQGIIQFTGLRAESMTKVIEGLRTGDEALFDEGIRLQEQAERVAERFEGENSAE